MQKIAHFIDSLDSGGAETLVIEMCKQLNRYGDHSQVWHFGNPWLEDKCREYNIPSMLVPGYRFYKSINTIPIFSLIFAIFIKRQRIDILHSHLFGSIISASIAAFLTRTPHIGTLHDTYSLSEKRERVYWLRGATILNTKLVAVSQQMKDYIEGFGIFSSGTIQVILNGVDLNAFSGNTSGKCRAELGLGTKDIILISVGRLVPIKGYEVLIDAFSRLKIERGRPIRFLVVGDGPERGILEAEASQRGLKGQMLWLGHRNDVPDLLKSSDCFVLSSLSEGLPCSIIEAMAARLPVVATDVGGNAELVRNGISGYLVSPYDPVILANRLREMVSNDDKRRRFGKAAFEIARDNFSIDVMMKKYADLYSSLLG